MIKGLRRHAAALAACFAMTASLMWPWLAPILDSARDGEVRLPDLTDGFYHTWATAWSRAWALGDGEPGRVLFDAPTFHPRSGTFAYAEHSLGLLPFSLLLFAFFDSASAAYHAMLLLVFSLSAWSVFWMIRRLTRRTALGLAGAFLWLASSYHVADAERFLFHVVWGVPLMWIGLDGFVRSQGVARPLGWLALACASALWQCLIAWYVAQHVIVALTLFLLLWLFVPGKHSRRRALIGGAAVFAVLAVVLLPLYRLYDTAGDDVVLPSMSLIGRHSLSIKSAFWPGERPLRYFGVARVALALVGAVWLARRAKRLSPTHQRWIVLIALTALVAAILSLGPALKWDQRPIAALPYAWLENALPAVRVFRFLERWLNLVGLGLAFFGVFGLLSVWRLLPRAPRKLRLAALGAILGLVYWDAVRIPPISHVEVSFLSDPMVRCLRSMPAGSIVADIVEPLEESHAMLRQTQHWRPLIQGLSSNIPDDYYAREGFVQRWPSPAADATLVELGADVMIMPVDRFIRSGTPSDRLLMMDETFALVEAPTVGPEASLIPDVSLPPFAILRRGEHGLHFLGENRWRSLYYDPRLEFELSEPVHPAAVNEAIIEAVVSAPAEEKLNSQLFWSTTAAPEFNEYRSIRVVIPASDSTQTIRFPLADLAGWPFESPITGLRWDPASCENATIVLYGIQLTASEKANPIAPPSRP